MNHKSAITTNDYSLLGEIISCLFGIVAMGIGILNTFWGNDPGYGIFVFLLSFVYFPPASSFVRKISGIRIPLLAKIILALFILWTALGVAELLTKIALMKKDMVSAPMTFCPLLV